MSSGLLKEGIVFSQESKLVPLNDRVEALHNQTGLSPGLFVVCTLAVGGVLLFPHCDRLSSGGLGVLSSRAAIL